jgi:hypothetical protein
MMQQPLPPGARAAGLAGLAFALFFAFALTAAVFDFAAVVFFEAFDFAALDLEALAEAARLDGGAREPVFEPDGGLVAFLTAPLPQRSSAGHRRSGMIREAQVEVNGRLRFDNAYPRLSASYPQP